MRERSSKEKVVGRTHKEVFNVEMPWLGTVAKVASSGTPVIFEYNSVVAGKWLEVYAYSPKQGQFASIIKDIAEKKQAEEALRESEERFRSVLDNTRDALLFA